MSCQTLHCRPQRSRRALDRDKDCAPGYASPTCNSYGVAGTWGFTDAFIAKLGL